MQVRRLRREVNPYEVIVDDLHDHIQLVNILTHVQFSYATEGGRAFARKLLDEIESTQNWSG